MSRIIIIDTYYPDFLKTLTIDPDSTYQAELDKVLWQSFGTADFYSRGLRAYGWDAIDVIANEERLQRMWAKENHGAGDVLLAQIADFKPDVVFFQDLSVCRPEVLAQLKIKYIVAGQCSCPMPAEEKVKQFDVLFTSFPHYIAKFESLGVRAVYNPLAFDPIITLARTPPPVEREIDVAFVGGVGNPSHWQYGMQVLDKIARRIPTSFFWGYGYDLLSSNSPIRQRYRGQAFGLRMYEILQRSKIVINRHGEVAQGYSNNMRLFEATGCGALLFTENSPNIGDFFNNDEVVIYHSPDEAVYRIEYFLGDWDDRGLPIAMRGQDRTMRDHTYSKRMKTVSDVLNDCIWLLSRN